MFICSFEAALSDQSLSDALVIVVDTFQSKFPRELSVITCPSYILSQYRHDVHNLQLHNTTLYNHIYSQFAI